jgi:hypothetical protein
VEAFAGGVEGDEGGAQEAVAFFEAGDFGALAGEVFGGLGERVEQIVALSPEGFVGGGDETLVLLLLQGLPLFVGQPVVSFVRPAAAPLRSGRAAAAFCWRRRLAA